MPGGGFPAPASLGSHGKIGFVCFSQALRAGGGGPDSSKEVAWRRAHPLAQTLTKPLGDHYVIMGHFGMRGGTAVDWRQEPRAPALVLPQTSDVILGKSCPTGPSQEGALEV